ncbi:MAG TPA: ATP phosphoribosyltransferase regulatory subunit [Longimicrobium sp.]|nr:ATP phosphoribosyltransferase regulatory subunit [Longimicrobium sp.]
MPSSLIPNVPPGSLDLLAGDVRRRRRVQHTWFVLSEAHGYQEVIPPTFEYEEVFTRSAGPGLAARLIRFVDRDGRLVALRADYTSAIARVVATRLAGVAGPLRLSYAGKVYRQEPEGVGRRREIFQLGAELIGDPSAHADVESLRLVVSLMRALEVGEFQINLGDIRFISPLLRGLPPEPALALRTAIDRKDRAALADARELGASDEVARVLAELPELIGRGDVLARARELACGPEAEAAIERLRQVDALLSDDERRHVVYDLGEIRGLEYYSGIQFEVFVAGVGRAVGYGGRYDGLLALYGGADRPAVGFALDIDALADLVTENAS